jgi:hypothetical protein
LTISITSNLSMLVSLIAMGYFQLFLVLDSMRVTVGYKQVLFHVLMSPMYCTVANVPTGRFKKFLTFLPSAVLGFSTKDPRKDKMAPSIIQYS